jgi:hypothetical protein|tara:strand:+ start:1010 stop:1189 length:180 start_codon:yes stop_codon:yes gene_type:complete
MKKTEKDDDVGETMTNHHYCKFDTWVRGVVDLKAVKPWSLGHPGIASDIKGVSLMRKFP